MKIFIVSVANNVQIYIIKTKYLDFQRVLYGINIQKR